MSKEDKKRHVFNSRKVQLTTTCTDFFVVAQMSVDLVGFVKLVGVGYDQGQARGLDKRHSGPVGFLSIQVHLTIGQNGGIYQLLCIYRF